ncbi:MAG: ABC transporter ATP-binding protein, partial [Nitrospinae bacterium]|nr:ABC transporter ATP-binding protein [Nitrospinota bacterium]
MTAAVAAEGLVRDFGVTRAVNDVSFSVQEGEMFGIVGPDGAGKTTLIRMLAGIMRPTSGRSLLFGNDPRETPEVMRNEVGYFSQKFSLYGDLTVEENIAFFAEIHGVRNHAERGEELLEFTRLAPFRRRLAEKLSGGMKQKLALVCAIIHKPRIIFLDEPTTGVDPLSRMDFWKILSSLLRTKITIIMSTPYMDEAERCGRIALMNRGELLAEDSPYNIRRRMGGEILEVVCDRPRVAKRFLESVPGIQDVQSFGDRLNISSENAEAARTAVSEAMGKAGLGITSMRVISPSLENVFISLMA